MNQYIDRIEIVLRNIERRERQKIYIDVFDNSLSHTWLLALIEVISSQRHLEKNYCFVGFPYSGRDGGYICTQINHSIAAINNAALGYKIDDSFLLDDLLASGPVGDGLPGLKLKHQRFNRLHRYFEDLQGVSGSMSQYYLAADAQTRWHIRQLNLLCHEFETWALSWRHVNKGSTEWARPSQLMCWLKAPRFALDDKDFELFGIESLNRDLGGVYVGVNKAIGKHHWEVFTDEGRDSRVSELETTSLRGQTEAAADFDIEWAQDTRGHGWMIQQLDEFRHWLNDNGFDADDPALTLGHPKVGQVDLSASFAGANLFGIWNTLASHMDVYSITVDGKTVIYDYHWSDANYMLQQIQALGGD
jgi:hypothetical protein